MSQTVGSSIANIGVRFLPAPPPIPSTPPVALAIGAVASLLTIASAIEAYRDIGRQQDIANRNIADLQNQLSRINTGSKSIISPPPFQGGQTLGTVYNVTIQVKAFKTDGTVDVFTNTYNGFAQPNGIVGAVRGLRVEQPKNGSWGVFLLCNNYALQPYEVTAQNGLNISYVSIEARITNIVRAGGNADTGGDPQGTKIGETFTPIPNGIGTGDPTEESKIAPPPATFGGTTNNTFGGATVNNSTTRNTFNSITNGRNDLSIGSTSIGLSAGIGSILGLAGSPVISPNPSPVTSPPPTTQPPPSTKPDEEKKTGFPPPSQPPSELGNINNQLDQIRSILNNQIAGIGAITGTIAANTSPEAQRLNSKNGACDALNSPSCTKGVEDRIKDPVLQNVGAVASIVDATSNKLDGVKAFLEKVARSAKLDKIYNLLTFITVIHNAQMLSSSLATTLMDSLSLGLATFGVKDENESPIDIQQIINKSVEDAVKSVIGTANYNTISERWKSAVRVYQAGANILYQIRSLWDSAKSLNELTGANVGRIGNALRRDGVVSENAYPAMPDSPLMVNSAMTRLQNLEEAASHLSSITSEAYGITETVAQIKKDQEDFKKLVKESPVTNGTANDAQKAKDDAAKIASVSPPISTSDLVKPD